MHQFDLPLSVSLVKNVVTYLRSGFLKNIITDSVSCKITNLLEPCIKSIFPKIPLDILGVNEIISQATAPRIFEIYN